jgi:hypothetical protein
VDWTHQPGARWAFDNAGLAGSRAVLQSITRELGTGRTNYTAGPPVSQSLDGLLSLVRTTRQVTTGMSIQMRVTGQRSGAGTAGGNGGSAAPVQGNANTAIVTAGGKPTPAMTTGAIIGNSQAAFHLDGWKAFDFDGDAKTDLSGKEIALREMTVVNGDGFGTAFVFSSAPEATSENVLRCWIVVEETTESGIVYRPAKCEIYGSLVPET